MLEKIDELEAENEELKRKCKINNEQLQKMIDSIVVLNENLGREEVQNEGLRVEIEKLEGMRSSDK